MTETISERTFPTQAWGPSNRLDLLNYSVHRTTFDSHGSLVAANLLTPKKQGPCPTIVIVGPLAYVKEQAPLQYATRLVAMGFVVLIFDPRCHGESEGSPRRNENPTMKIEDISASIAFLIDRPEVDSARIFVLGLCQGVNWTIEVARIDRRIAAVCLVAGHYLTPDVARMYLGGDREVAERVKRSLDAADVFRKTGVVHEAPIVSSSFTTPDPAALLGAPFIQSFYVRWADRHPMLSHRGFWENRITTMSEHLIWGYRIDLAVQDLHLPVMMLHADRAASGAEIPRRLFDAIPSTRKSLVWLGPQGQIQFYEDPITIDLVVPHIEEFLNGLPQDTFGSNADETQERDEVRASTDQMESFDR